MIFQSIQQFRKNFDVLPSLTFFAGVFGGCSALYFFDFPDRQTIFFCALCFLIPGWLLLGTRRALIRYALPMFAAAISALIAVNTRENAFGKDAAGWNNGCVGLQLKLRLTDPGFTGGKPDWMPSYPTYTQVQAEAFRYTDCDQWKKCSTEILVRFPSGMLVRPSCGELWLVSGRIEKIRSPAFPGAFDFRSYAVSRGTEWILYPYSAVLLEKGSGFRHELFRMRSFLLEKLGSGMSGAFSRELAAAMLFGMKQCPEKTEKDYFRKSGTIHLLSVSGLHISMIVSVLVLLFKVFPYRVRYLLPLVPAVLYGMASGMQNPVSRALLMFSVWCIFRAMYLRTSSVNSILFAAAVMLLLNPNLLLDLGFRYSFLCVLILLSGFQFFRDLHTAMNTDQDSRAFTGKKKWRYRFLRELAQAVAASMAAWLCSTAVSLCSQGYFTWSAVPAYLLMSFAAWVSFALFTLSVIFCWIPGFTMFCGTLMEPFLRWITFSAALYSGDFKYTGVPSVWFQVVFITILILLLVFRKQVYFSAAGILLLGLLLCGVIFSPVFDPPEITVLSENGNTPILLFCAPAEKRAAVFNLPDSASARKTADYLHSKGIAEVENLIFTGFSRAECGGAETFLRIIPVRTIIFPGKVPKNALNAGKLVIAAKQNNCSVQYSQSSTFPFRKTDGKYEIRSRSPLWPHVLIEKKTDGTGTLIRVEQNGNEISRLTIPFSRDLFCESIPLKKGRLTLLKLPSAQKSHTLR